MIFGEKALKLVRESGWIGLGQVLVMVGSIFLVRILTSYLSPSEYGYLSLGMTSLNLINQVILGGIVAGIGRYYIVANEQDEVKYYYDAAKTLMGRAGLVSGLVGILCIGVLAIIGQQKWIYFTLVALIYAITSGYNSAVSSIQNAARKRAIVALHGGLNAVLKIIITLVILNAVGASSSLVITAYLISMCIVLFSQHRMLKDIISQGKKSTSSGMWGRKIWEYSKPFIKWGGFTWLFLASDRWALQVFSSSAEVGQYSVLYQLGFAPIVLLTGMCVSLIGPILYEKSGDASDDIRNANVHSIMWKITIVGLLFVGFAVLFGFVFHDVIFKYAVSEEYRSVSYLLPWMLLAGGQFGVSQILALKLMADMNPQKLTLVKIVSAVFGIILNIYGAYSYGILGIVVATVIFSVINLIWTSILSRNRKKHAY